jgi:hypothetical protein
LLSHLTACSPEAGLKIAGTVVVVTGTVVAVVAIIAIVVSFETEEPLHAVNANKATGSNRFNMMFSA